MQQHNGMYSSGRDDSGRPTRDGVPSYGLRPQNENDSFTQVRRSDSSNSSNGSTTRWTTRVLFSLNSKVDISKSAPHKTLKLIA